MVQRCLTYIERDGHPVPEPDAARFAAWLAAADRRIAFTALDRGVTIETLFLAHAHQRDDGRLYHYASLVQTEALGWGSERLYYQQRQLAIEGHASIVQELLSVLTKLEAARRQPG